MTTIPPEIPPGVDNYQRAQETIEILRERIQTVEGFGHPAPERRRKIAGYIANISDVELHAAARACDAQPRLAASAQMTGAQFREGISFCDANEKVMEELALQHDGLAAAVQSKRAELANAARRVYQTAQSLNKPGEANVIIPNIDALEAAFKRPRKRSATTPPPATPPASTTPPVAATPPVTTQPVPPAVPAVTTTVPAPAPSVVKV
jgi:hypothetical protein